MKIRRLAAVVTFSGICAPLVYSAEQYSFDLVTTSSVPFSGTGYFIVDSTSVTPSFSGYVSASYIYFSFVGSFQGSQSFGTDFGSVVYNYSSVSGQLVDISHINTPAAVVEFTDGFATGVQYSEQHTCTGQYHCEPSEIVNLSGSVYSAFAYPSGNLGDSAPLIITAAVPEPTIAAVLCAGLLVLPFMRRGWLVSRRA